MAAATREPGLLLQTGLLLGFPLQASRHVRPLQKEFFPSIFFYLPTHSTEKRSTQHRAQNTQIHHFFDFYKIFFPLSSLFFLVGGFWSTKRCRMMLKSSDQHRRVGRCPGPRAAVCCVSGDRQRDKDGRGEPSPCAHTNSLKHTI